MTAASQPEVVTLRSGDVVQVRQVQPGDAPALVRAYANLGEQSRYRRFFTVMPELPEATLKAAVQVDHENHEALVAVPLPSAEIVDIVIERRSARKASTSAGVILMRSRWLTPWPMAFVMSSCSLPYASWWSNFALVGMAVVSLC